MRATEQARMENGEAQLGEHNVIRLSVLNATELQFIEKRQYSISLSAVEFCVCVSVRCLAFNSGLC